MKQGNFITWNLIVGIILMFPLSGIALGNPEGKEAYPDMETQKWEKVIITPSSDDQREKPNKGLESQNKKMITPVSMPVYKPPLRGAPGGLVGGGTRGTGKEVFTLYVLVPDHVGLTIQEQPALYWYLSKKIRYPVELTIIQDQAIFPLLEIRINPPDQPGVRRIRLADYGVRLSPGVQYQWFVSIIQDTDHRSKDIIAGGLIERIEPPEALRDKLSKADKAEATHIYAEAGLWYDALQAISDLIDISPNNSALRKQRASLLKQVGLTEIAEYEIKQGIPSSP